jgi:hypothetical protein
MSRPEAVFRLRYLAAPFPSVVRLLALDFFRPAPPGKTAYLAAFFQKTQQTPRRVSL